MQGFVASFILTLFFQLSASLYWIITPFKLQFFLFLTSYFTVVIVLRPLSSFLNRSNHCFIRRGQRAVVSFYKNIIRKPAWDILTPSSIIEVVRIILTPLKKSPTFYYIFKVFALLLILTSECKIRISESFIIKALYRVKFALLLLYYSISFNLNINFSLYSFKVV
jgi:hypothetical protein